MLVGIGPQARMADMRPVKHSEPIVLIGFRSPAFARGPKANHVLASVDVMWSAGERDPGTAMITRRRFLTISACAAASVAAGSHPALSQDTVRWEGFALGASCSLTIAGLTVAQAGAAMTAATGEIERMEALFSLYRRDSELARLNATGRLEYPSPDMRRIIRLCGNVHALTGGVFDPTVQPVWRLMAEAEGRPSRHDLRAARALVGWNLVDVETGAISFRRDGMALTLNGVAQGYATDRVAAVLRMHGLANVLVNIGEIAALGEKAPGRSWRVGIADRSDSTSEDVIDLVDSAIATSAPLGTAFDPAGRIGHIIDPADRAHRPRWRRVSVTHRSAAVADALSTGFCLMDRDAIIAAAASAGAGIASLLGA